MQQHTAIRSDVFTQEAKEIVKSTAPVVAEHCLEIVATFYPLMFSTFPSVKKQFNMAHQTGHKEMGAQRVALASAILEYATNLDNLGSLTELVERIVHKHCSLGVGPHQYLYVGSCLLQAIKIVLGDAITPVIMDAWAQIYWTLANLLIEKELLLYKTLTERSWSGFKKLVVSKKVPETHQVNSLYLKTADGSPVPSFMPGQFVSLHLTFPNGEEHFRNYSLSCPPGRGYLRVSVKAIAAAGDMPDGKVSNFIKEGIKEGDCIEVAGPFGNVCLSEEELGSDEPMTLIGAGIGCTPLVSMMHAIAHTNPKKPLNFVYVTQDLLSHPFVEEMKQLKKELHCFNVTLFYTSPALLAQENEESKVGLADSVVLGKFKEDSLGSVPALQEKKGKVYLLGPVGWMEITLKALLKLGYQHNQIFYELFGPHKNLRNQK